MKKEEIYIDFVTNSYSLTLLLLSLEQSGIRNFAIIMEDGELHIRIAKSHLEEIVYHRNEYADVAYNCMPQKEELKNA